MKLTPILCIALLVFSALPDLVAQNGVWSSTYETREEFNNLIQLSTSNYVMSGQTHELGNKSDLVILADELGVELSRTVLCESCQQGNVVQSIETASQEILHFRSNGDLYSSNLSMTETTFEFNISQDKFESIETYEILRSNNFLIVVSYAVQDDVKGLLHTVMDSRDKLIYNQKFNVEFPDISGSIGVGIFDDQGVVDGYNTEVGGSNVGHLVRLGRYREVVWEVDLDFGDIVLEHPLVASNQDVYAVGNITDENNPDHKKGLIVKYDQDGTLIWSKEFDAEGVDNSDFDSALMNFTDIEQVSTDEFVITGFEGGISSGDLVTSALVFVIDSEGNLIKRYSSSLLSTTVVASDVVQNKNGELVYVAKAFKNNAITGSYISGTRDASTSIENVISESSDFVFPNPFADRLFINELYTSGTYQIVDMAGKVVMIGNLSPQISVSGISSGLYIIRLIPENKLNTRLMKIVKI